VLSATDNELLRRVRLGTPMGDYMRQFWVPVMRAALVRSGGDPVFGRALCTNLVVFRSRDGQLGCLDEACPHRRASLALAYNSGDGLTCLYHQLHQAWLPATTSQLGDVAVEAARGRRSNRCKTTPGTRHQARARPSPVTSSETTFRSVREPVLGLPDSRAVDGAVDGGAGDVEQLGEFGGGGVSSCLVERQLREELIRPG
jgi:nitrite reductase/ring-hydroxylating ferredoxin subunit